MKARTRGPAAAYRTARRFQMTLLVIVLLVIAITLVVLLVSDR
jgi:hypothetical protein